MHDFYTHSLTATKKLPLRTQRTSKNKKNSSNKRHLSERWLQNYGTKRRFYAHMRPDRSKAPSSATEMEDSPLGGIR